MARLFHGLNTDVYGAATFDGYLNAGWAGDVSLSLLEADRHRVTQTQASPLASDIRYLKILAPWKGHAAVHQYGRQVWVRPGGWAIYDTTDDYHIDNPERTQHLVVMIPKEPLVERGLKLDALMGRHVGGVSGISRVALETMRNTYQELPHMTPDVARGAGNLILEMVHLSLLELAGRGNAATQLESFRDRIRSYVGQNLRDPGLSIDRIAQVLRCSKRHLHNSFATEECTLGHYIQHCRLNAIVRDLKNPQLQHRTITDIAFSWGFNNGAHFSRVFREHVGISPSEFRHMMATNHHPEGVQPSTLASQQSATAFSARPAD